MTVARIVLGSYMVRYPLGGNLSWALQYLLGMHRLGHDVYFVENAGYANSCFDPERNVMSDDCSYGVRAVSALLRRYGLGDRWCYVDGNGDAHGMTRAAIDEAIATADAFIDMGTHGAWLEQAQSAGVRVMIDGLPGFTQIKMANEAERGGALPSYDFFYTNGMNVGQENCLTPTAGLAWGHIFHPVVCDIFEPHPPPADAPFTTVMNWQSDDPVIYHGESYGQKDIEFEKFFDLPTRTPQALELAVAGTRIPRERLEQHGWRLRSGHEVTMTYDDFVGYVNASRGELSIARNAFVALNTAWFSDRGTAYLACGRPVVQQETGFSQHLPCGEGLFAVKDAAEAADAIEAIRGDYDRHSRRAREIARDCLDGSVVLARFLREIGVGA